MNFPIKNYLFFLAGVSLCFSSLGCDQVKKFIDYLSPNTKVQTAQPSQQQAPAEKPAVQDQPLQQTVQQQQPVPQQQVVQKQPAPDVLIQVGDWSMTISEFNTQITALEGLEGFDSSNVEQKRYILSELLQQQVLAQEAIRRNLDKDKEVVEALKNLKNTILVQALITREAENITVTDQEVKAFYDANPEEFTLPYQWHIREIVVPNESQAKEILVELNQGASFAEIAKERSVSKSAAQEGDLGLLYAIPDVDIEIPADAPVIPFKRMEQIVSALDVGGVSGAFSGPQGFYIVKLIDRKGGELQNLEEIREDLKEYMLAIKQQNALFGLLEEAQKHLEININEKLLEE